MNYIHRQLHDYFEQSIISVFTKLGTGLSDVAAIILLVVQIHGNRCRQAATNASLGCFAADVHFKTKADGKVILKDGVEYLQVNTIKAQIQVGDSSVKISDRDDKRGLLSEYPCLIMFRDPHSGIQTPYRYSGSWDAAYSFLIMFPT